MLASIGYRQRLRIAMSTLFFVFTQALSLRYFMTDGHFPHVFKNRVEKPDKRILKPPPQGLEIRFRGCFSAPPEDPEELAGHRGLVSLAFSSGRGSQLVSRR